MAAKTETSEINAAATRKRDLDLVIQTIAKEYGDGAILWLLTFHLRLLAVSCEVASLLAVVAAHLIAPVVALLISL